MPAWAELRKRHTGLAGAVIDDPVDIQSMRNPRKDAIPRCGGGGAAGKEAGVVPGGLL